MKKPFHRIILDTINITLPIFVGGAIYLLFRPTNLLMFRWVEALELNDTLNSLRHTTKQILDWADGFIIFNAPTMLWTFSFTYAIALIWRGHRYQAIRIVFLTIVCLVAILSEISQLFGMIHGTYDSQDLLANITGFLAAIYFTNSRKINHETRSC